MRIIAGRWGGRPIAAPPGARTRPTTDRVREAWMSRLQHDLPGARVLDVFAGSGALGLEALSRGADHVTFVERAQSAVRALQANVRALDATGQVEIVRGDAVKFASGLEAGSFDIALADPPYDTDAAQRLLAIFAAVPFARLLCLEHRSGTPLPVPADADARRYGDTTITFIMAPS